MYSCMRSDSVASDGRRDAEDERRPKEERRQITVRWQSRAMMYRRYTVLRDVDARLRHPRSDAGSH